ncbi:MAG: NAD(P)/FAD-dependent oxidoreductase [Aquisalinus sp.]|nr:NAD(P)/FAD-dependent oxidoreductase [Aquisalinus sp.]
METDAAKAHVDVLIIGAGISGLSAAWHLQKHCPDKSYAILEQRAQIGGTWDLFRYPGIRSDSDMYTLGYRFKPWTHEKAIASGDAILSYLNETADEHSIRQHIQFNREVLTMHWSSEEARWHVSARNTETGTTDRYTCSFVSVCAGYYNYKAGYTPEFEGRADFQGDIIHPQHWPKELDYSDKRVVVIGSGATAVTLIPSMAERAAHITMLQRSPSYVVSRPAEDKIAQAMMKVLPASWVYTLIRWRNVLLQMYMFRSARKNPQKARDFVLDLLKEELPENYDIDRHFTPSYDPWDQRLCLVPDSDLFQAISNGSASVVTDHIDRFTPDGILLESGNTLPADIIVTATGLDLHNFGGACVYVDDREVHSGEVMTYKGMMYSDVPNMSATFGYTNASWTLKADLTSEYMCRILNHMDKEGVQICTPRLTDPTIVPEPVVDFSSGYFKRAEHKMPKQGSTKPWRLNQNYALDILEMRFGKIDDGILEFSNTQKVDETISVIAAE